MVFAATPASAKTNLGGGKWELVELGGRTVSNSDAFIEFNGDNRFAGNAGCNPYFGSYSLRGVRFESSAVGSTKRMCVDPRLRRIENGLLQAIGDANRLRINGNNLVLLKGRIRLAKFRMAEDTDAQADLANKKWILRSIGGRSVSLGNETPFLNFDAKKGSAGGNTGCNVFGGSYGAEGSTIKFTDMISTMRACEFEDRMSVERGFIDGLRKADRYEIKGGKLILFEGRTRVLEFEGVLKK